MLQFKDDPKELMLALDRFLSIYYGDRQVEFKPNLQEIAARRIPTSLKHFYSFAEKYPGEHGTLTTQDGLYLQKGESTYKNKLLIVGENQGCWSCGTEIDGEDPPVWVEDGDYGQEKFGFATWRLVCNSLSQFLVTFSLQEALFASEYLGNTSTCRSMNPKANLEKLLSALEKQGYEVNLLWQGKYAWDVIFEEEYNKIIPLNYFYSVEDAILIWNNGWYGTNYKNADRLLSSIELV